jgi:hypothetical protein
MKSDMLIKNNTNSNRPTFSDGYVRPSEGFEPSSSGFFQQHLTLLSTAAYTDQAILRRPFNIGLIYIEYIIVR